MAKHEQVIAAGHLFEAFEAARASAARLRAAREEPRTASVSDVAAEYEREVRDVLAPQLIAAYMGMIRDGGTNLVMDEARRLLDVMGRR